MKFNQADYWKKRGGDYYKNHLNETEEFEYFRKQEVFLMNKIKEEFSRNSISSVLEIGCGYGRITEKLLHYFDSSIREYKGIDISQGQIDNAKKYLKDHNVRFEPDFEVANFFEYKDPVKYDMVFSAEVFYHFEPEQIEEALKISLSLTNKYLVLLNEYPGVVELNVKNSIKTILNKFIGKFKPYIWQFNHDYIGKIDDTKIKIIKVYPNKELKHCLYIIEKL